MMQTWNELLAVVEQMCLNEDSDALYCVMRNLECTHLNPSMLLSTIGG
jgi:hypothetical protein